MTLQTAQGLVVLDGALIALHYEWEFTPSILRTSPSKETSLSLSPASLLGARQRTACEFLVIDDNRGTH